MRFLVPLLVSLAVAAFHSALCASLESAEKEGKAAQYDGLTELQKIDQMEFEAAQTVEVAQMNVTEERSADARYLEAAQGGSVEERVDAEGDATTEGGGNAAAAAAAAAPAAAAAAAAAHEESESESSEEADGRQRREHHEAVTETVSGQEAVGQDSTKKQDVLE